GSGTAPGANGSNGRNSQGVSSDVTPGVGAGPTGAGAAPTGTSATPQTPPSPNINSTEKAAAPLSVQLRELLDTAALGDVRRVEAGGSGAALVASFLQRLVVTGQLFDEVAPRHVIAMSATAAAKIFDAPAARSENVAIAQTSLMWRAALGPRISLVPAGTYYEAFQSWG